MNEAERAIVRDGLREIEARLQLLKERSPPGAGERVVIDGVEYAWLSRTLAVVEGCAAVAPEGPTDLDLPGPLRGERPTTKAVYRVIRRVRQSRSGPTAVLKAANLYAAVPGVLGEERSMSAVHQACRRLRKLGYLERAGGFGWTLAKGASHEPAPPPDPPGAPETAQLHSGAAGTNVTSGGAG